LEVHVVVK